MRTLLAILALAALPATASAASPLRPPTNWERTSILRWVGNHQGDAAAVNKICVHRKRSRYAVARTADVRTGWEGTVLRRHGRRWRFVTGGTGWDGGPVLQALLRRSCALRRVKSAPALEPTQVLSDRGFGPLRIGMTQGGAQWSTRTKLLISKPFNPPCNTFTVRGMRTLWGLTTNDVVRRLSISAFPMGGPRLQTAAGLQIGDRERRVLDVYGRPHDRRPYIYDPNGEVFTYVTTRPSGRPQRRIIVTNGRNRVQEVSVGFRPEVAYVEGCA
jgi:hypothetical protein